MVFPSWWWWHPLIYFLPGQSCLSDFSSLVAVEVWGYVKLCFLSSQLLIPVHLTTEGILVSLSVVLSFQPRLKHMFWLHNQEKVDAVQSSVFYCSYFITHRKDSPMAPSFSFHLSSLSLEFLWIGSSLRGVLGCGFLVTPVTILISSVVYPFFPGMSQHF